jgi:hypothetical protein
MPATTRNEAAHGGSIEQTTYPVTLIIPRPPFIEVGAYAYTGEQLPAEGETITLRSILSPWGPRLHEFAAQVTRVDRSAEIPISAKEIANN